MYVYNKFRMGVSMVAALMSFAVLTGCGQKQEAPAPPPPAAGSPGALSPDAQSQMQQQQQKDAAMRAQTQRH